MLTPRGFPCLVLNPIRPKLLTPSSPIFIFLFFGLFWIVLVCPTLIVLIVKELHLYCRSYLHSFSTAAVAFSAAFCGKAMGITILSYMDELYTLFQVL